MWCADIYPNTRVSCPHDGGTDAHASSTCTLWVDNKFCALRPLIWLFRWQFQSKAAHSCRCTLRSHCWLYISFPLIVCGPLPHPPISWCVRFQSIQGYNLSILDFTVQILGMSIIAAMVLSKTRSEWMSTCSWLFSWLASRHRRTAYFYGLPFVYSWLVLCLLDTTTCRRKWVHIGEAIMYYYYYWILPLKLFAVVSYPRDPVCLQV